MGDSLADGTHWCHLCEQVVTPVMELEVEVKCPFCDGGFVEVMDGREEDANLRSDRSLSLWAPILLGMLGGARARPRRFGRGEEFDEDNEGDDADEDRELRALLWRQRRGSAVLQLLQGLREDARPESADNLQRERERDWDQDEDGESMVLISAFNQAVIFRGSSVSDQTQGHDGAGATSSLGDYFVEPGLDILLQHLAENGPNRYGTPPTTKEVVDALPTVKIGENISCSVCLEDFGIGSEAREMPCQHQFHSSCILPWLELHSSCPVCRFQLPADESKDSNESGSRVVEGIGGDGANIGGRGSGDRLGVPVPWPFNELFSLSGSQTSGNSSSTPSSSTSGSDSHADEN